MVEGKVIEISTIPDANLLISELAKGNDAVNILPCSPTSEKPICLYANPTVGCAEQGVGGLVYSTKGEVLCPLRNGSLRWVIQGNLTQQQQ